MVAAVSRQRSLPGALRDVSIGTKLNIITFAFAVALVLQLGATMIALEFSEAVQAYLAAESLWSKAQKDGAIELRRYIRTGEPAAYQRYRDRLGAVLAFRRARLEMDKPDFNPAVADEGFRQAGVRSSDARNDMVWLYRCCHDISFFADAVATWRKGDMRIDDLMRIAEAARARIEGRTATEVYRDAVLDDVFATNRDLTALEERFSNLLIDGAARVHNLLVILTALVSGFLLVTVLLIALRITRLLTEGTANLKQGITRLNAGDRSVKIPVLSADELGELAVTFNTLTSQRMQIEAALDREREFLKVMLDSMSDGIAACDARGVLTFFNAALQDMLGLPAEPMPPARWAEHYAIRLPDGQLLPSEQMPLLRALHGAQVDNQELLVGRHQGGGRAVLATARRIVGPDGEVAGAVLAVHDISARKSAEQAQRTQHALVQAIVTAAVDGVIVIDEANRITLFNPAAERIFGYPAAEVMGQNVNMLMPEPYHSRHDAYVRSYLETGVAKIIGSGREVVGRRKDGSTFPMDLAVAEIKLGGRPMFTGTVRDVTQRKAQAEAIQRHAQDLERANKELEQFTFAAAHDLQTPLRGLVGFAQLLERNLKDQLRGEPLELLHGIEKSALAMHRLVQSLLEYMQVGNQPKRHWVNLNHLLTEVEVGLAFLIKERAAVIHSETLPTLFVDAPQMMQLLRSLIENAIKFQPRQPPEVRLSAERDARGWVIGVADAGIGVPPEHHQRIFQIFQRLHTSEQYEGAGIGLTLAEKIVTNHGGRIWVESEAGQGATFYFSIPDAQ